MPTETIELNGHIVDSLLLAKVLDAIVEAGVDHEIIELEVGRSSRDASVARIALTGDAEVLGRLLDDLALHGARRIPT